MLRWGLIGAGRAGRARTKAILHDPRSRLIGAFGGDPETLGVGVMPSLEVLFDSVDAVAICTPDVSHAALARTALVAGMHVLVEYPLAGSREVAATLLEFAASRSRVLHVEHIELLSATHLVFARHLQGASVLGGPVRFTGPPRQGLLSVAHANVARLHRVVDAIGLPDSIEGSTTGGLVEGSLGYGAAGVSLRFELGEDLPRRTDMLIETTSGKVRLEGKEVLVDGVVSQLDEQPGLFASDQRRATARILDGGPSYVSDSRVLDVLGLADALSST